MAEYQLTATDIVIHTTTNASIPNDPANRDRVDYVAWLAAGGVPDPYVQPPIPVPYSVTRRQYYMQGVVQGWFTQAQALALIQLGTLPPSVIAFVNTLPVGQQFAANMYLVGAANYERNNPLLLSMTAAGGLSSATIDAVFRAAALL